MAVESFEILQIAVEERILVVPLDLQSNPRTRVAVEHPDMINLV